MKQLSIYETDYLDDLNTMNAYSAQQTSHQSSSYQSTSHQELRDLNTQDLSTKDSSLNNSPEKAVANVTEIIIAKDKANSIQMVLPMLSQLNQEQRWLAWIDPPIQLLKQWQEAHQELAMEEIMILRSSDSISAIELSKRALEAGTCHAVIAWTNCLSQSDFTQLEAASAKGNSHGIVLRHR